MDIVISEDARSPLNPMGLKGAGEAHQRGRRRSRGCDRRCHWYAGSGNRAAHHTKTAARAAASEMMRFADARLAAAMGPHLSFGWRPTRFLPALLRAVSVASFVNRS